MSMYNIWHPELTLCIGDAIKAQTLSGWILDMEVTWYLDAQISKFVLVSCNCPPHCVVSLALSPLF